MKQSRGGRPPRYESAEELQKIIDEYFKQCEGHILKDESGQAVLDKYNRPIIIDAKPPTVTGLALALGFASRQALLNYQGKKEFNDTITRAKARVEEYAESRLFDRDGVRGAMFSLKNNFKHWDDETRQGHNDDDTNKNNLFDMLKQSAKELQNDGMEKIQS